MTVKKTIPIFIFSGTGNTWWVSEQLVKQLRNLGLVASTHSIEQVTKEQISKLIAAADMVGFGFPIYGSDAPRIFHDFIDDLPVLDRRKDTLGFVTQMAWSGDGCNFLEKILSKKGYKLRWTAEFNLPNNIALPIFPLPYSADYAKFERQLQKCKDKAAILSEKIAHGETYREHRDVFSTASAWIQRGPFRLAHDWGRKFWSVDAEECTSCERCARLCPIENIQMVDGLPVHGDACVYCMRCFNYCPTLAIHYAGMSNKRAKKNPPFKGPVPEFRPEMICKLNK